MTTHFLADTAVLTGRSLRHITRSLHTIITTASCRVLLRDGHVPPEDLQVERGPVPPALGGRGVRHPEVQMQRGSVQWG
jgi:hypothetical protein